jgi:hypothetical protein
MADSREAISMAQATCRQQQRLWELWQIWRGTRVLIGKDHTVDGIREQVALPGKGDWW